MAKPKKPKYVAGGFRVGELVKILKSPDAPSWEGKVGRVTDHSQNRLRVAVQLLDLMGSVEFLPSEIERYQPKSETWGFVDTGAVVTHVPTGAVYRVDNQHGWVVLVPVTPEAQSFKFEALDKIDPNVFRFGR